MEKDRIKIGLAGFGTVGSGVFEILRSHQELIESRVGAPLALSKIATRTPRKAHRAGFPRKQVSASWRDLVCDPEIQIIVELMGGTGEARKLILEALEQGKHVVTANKALLSLHGKEIFEAARKYKRELCFEAAVAGGIPILRVLREGFSGDEILSMLGIINGTCNYILSAMAGRGAEFEEVLRDAQRLGFAEADPSFDIDGIDAAHKLSILLSIAYGIAVDPKAIHTEGIRRITPFDFQCAKRFGYTIKLLAVAKKTKEGLEARVHPTMLPLENPLASVQEAFNAILLEGAFAGPSLLYGKGAGKHPTASAVVGDLIEISRDIVSQSDSAVPPLGYSDFKVPRVGLLPIQKLEKEYYLRFSVIDQPGVLATITGILGRHQIGISSVYQHGREEEVGKTVPVVILTHRAREANVQKAIQQINRLSVVKEKTLILRIEQ